MLAEIGCMSVSINSVSVCGSINDRQKSVVSKPLLKPKQLFLLDIEFLISFSNFRKRNGKVNAIHCMFIGEQILSKKKQQQQNILVKKLVKEV